jgi:hypothetical protein
VRPVAVESPLADVADEEVGAARVAELADLPQELLNGDCGLVCAALAQVVAVGDRRGWAGTLGRTAAVRARWPGRSA